MSTPERLSSQELYEKKKIKRGYRGMLFALLAALTGAVMGIFNVTVMNLSMPSIPLDWDAKFVSSYAIISVMCLGIADTIGGIYAFIFNWITGRSIKEQLRTYKMPVAWLMLIGALIAGPLGNGLFMASIGLCSLMVVGACSSSVPLWGAVFGKLIMKENFGTRGIVGVLVIVAGVFIAGYSAPTAAPHTLLGMCLALAGAILMGLEGSVSTYAADLVDSFIGCSFFRAFGAGVLEICMACIIAVASGQTAAIGAIFATIFGTPLILVLVLIWGLSQAGTYMAIYGALPLIGPSRALALNFTIPFWSVPLSFLALKVMPTFTFDWTVLTIVGAITVGIGSIIVVINPKELLNIRKADETDLSAIETEIEE